MVVIVAAMPNTNIEPPKFIDAEPESFRRHGFRSEPVIHKVLMRSAVIAAIWFLAAIIFGRYVDHNQAWYVIAVVAFAPAALLGYIAVSLD